MSLDQINNVNDDVVPRTAQERSCDETYKSAIRRTREFWGDRGVSLSNEECRELVDNLTGFFKLLGRWDKGK